MSKRVRKRIQSDAAGPVQAFRKQLPPTDPFRSLLQPSSAPLAHVGRQAPLTRVERKKEKTRKALMEVALSLFYEKGIYGTKVEDITAKADVGKGTFYLYFDTKEAILQAVLQDGLESLLARMTNTVKTAQPGLKKVSAAIRSQLDFYFDYPEYLLLFHQICGLLQLKTGEVKELRDAYDAYLNRLGRLMRLALNGKGRKLGNARELGVALSAFTSGLLTYQILFGKAREPKRWRAEVQIQMERSIHALL